MASYTRQSSFSDGDTITAALFNNEYNQLLNAFAYASSSTTGHRHDGTAAEGGNIHTIGDQDFLNKIVADSTNNRWGVFVQVSSSAVEQVRFQDGAIVPVTDNDIDLGTSSVEFKDAYFDGTVTTDTLTVDAAATIGTTLGVTGGITSGSSILSDTDSTDSLGSTSVRWLKGWFDTLAAGTLTVGSGSVTDSSGAISFGNENLSTTGTLGAGATTVTTFTSTGIDDNASAETIQISDGIITIGGTSTGVFNFARATTGSTDGSLRLLSTNTVALGSSIEQFGSDHSTLAGDWRVLSS
jgi:hypothetical protein